MFNIQKSKYSKQYYFNLYAKKTSPNISPKEISWGADLILRLENLFPKYSFLIKGINFDENKDKQNEITKNNINEESSKVSKVNDYKGEKLSNSEGVGTTGKVFNSQKEALDFGKQEVKKLTEGDKKPRQFSISKVTAKDGSLVGWTVDIFEDNSIEKIVSNPIENTENNKNKE